MRKYAGRLVKMHAGGRFLTSADGETALFKDITLHVLDVKAIGDLQLWQGQSVQAISNGTVTLRLRIMKRELEVAVEGLRDHPRHPQHHYSR